MLALSHNTPYKQPWNHHAPCPQSRHLPHLPHNHIFGTSHFRVIGYTITLFLVELFKQYYFMELFYYFVLSSDVEM